MPCYHFTYHGYATWMPDRPQGYVHRTKGLQPRDEHMAGRYRDNQRESMTWFTDAHIDAMFETARGVQPHIHVTVHGVAADRTHLHILVSWKHDKTFEQIRSSIRSALIRMMNERFGKRTMWFSRTPSRKQVRGHEHFDWLMLDYFPDHPRHWVRNEDRIAALNRRGPARQ